jgi:hypothetical protein
MIQRAFLLILLMLATPLAAQSVKLKAHEIDALLSGNTAVGKWAGQTYRQFFDPDGSTIYAQEGARSTLGKWRIDPERDEYQSIWPRDAAWEGWFVMEFGGDFYWVSKSTPPTPFKVVEGQQLVARDAICEKVTAFAEAASTLEGTDAVMISLPEVFDSTPECGRSMFMSGQTSAHCSWAFPYRDAAARAAYETLVRRLTACPDAQAPKKAGKAVNHPDTYDQREIRVMDTNVSISLKDKAGLEQSFVFLRTLSKP